MLQSKLEKIASFDPNGVGQQELNIYGLPFTFEEADIILFPVPFEVTTSYGGGTIDGPEAIMEASYQVDLYDHDSPDTWKKGLYMPEISEQWKQISHKYKVEAQMLIHEQAMGKEVIDSPGLLRTLHDINEVCAQLHQWVYEQTLDLLKQGKKVGLVGGDHSTPLGYIRALGEAHGNFGILQIDAHADLRDAYEGFEYSHASIMFNALKLAHIEKLVQVGIRDICQDEVDVINGSNGRIKTYYDWDIKRRQFRGEHWEGICRDIISSLPKKVYISFDIDGLDPKLCPNTGTPVSGGFETEQVFYLFKLLMESDREIIGFDLNEVSPGEDEWDANVGARVLFKMCGLL